MPQETFIIMALYNVSSCSLKFSPYWTLPCLFYDDCTNECICLMKNKTQMYQYMFNGIW